MLAHERQKAVADSEPLIVARRDELQRHALLHHLHQPAGAKRMGATRKLARRTRAGRPFSIEARHNRPSGQRRYQGSHLPQCSSARRKPSPATVSRATAGAGETKARNAIVPDARAAASTNVIPRFPSSPPRSPGRPPPYRLSHPARAWGESGFRHAWRRAPFLVAPRGEQVGMRAESRSRAISDTKELYRGANGDHACGCRVDGLTPSACPVYLFVELGRPRQAVELARVTAMRVAHLAATSAARLTKKIAVPGMT